MSLLARNGPAVDRPGRRWGRWGRWEGGADGRLVSPSSIATLLGVTLAATLLSAGALSVHLIVANPGEWSGAALLDLGLSLGWISLLLNGLFALVLCGAHTALVRIWPGVFRGHRLAFLVSGLPALHIAWMLLNRLALVQRLVYPPVFLTPSGLIQAVGIGLVAMCVVAAGMATRHRPGRSFLALSAAAILAFGALQWNAGAEVAFRSYSMERIHTAARSGGAGWEPPAAAVNGPVIVIALDGWGWDVLVPLLETGLMPHTATLIQQGAVGYLDNGDDSFSPRIWNTIFTGRPVDDHGIHDFVALRFLASGRILVNLVSQTPAIDSFYGMKQLLRRFPSLGLWEFVALDSSDVRVKAIWDVAGDHDRRVVVANVLNTVPVRPVRGAMVSLQEEADARNFYPPALADRWIPTPPPRKRALEDWDDALVKEADLTLALFREHEVDLGIYYTKAVDVLAHDNWDFYAEDAWVATDAPASVPDGAWEALVARNADSPVFAAYQMIDAQLGRFRRAHPDATFVLVSDHAWTFSGYQHYGSQDGIVLVSGPRARAGAAIAGASIDDVMPTLLAMLEIPLADELSGRVLEDALLEKSRLETIATYGPKPEPSERASEVMALEPETLSELVELGYVQ